MKANKGNGEAVVPFAKLNSFEAHEYRNTVWRHTTAVPVTREILESSDYYSVVRSKLTPFDRIIVIDPHGENLAEVIIVDAESGFPIVAQVLHFTKLRKPNPKAYSELPKGYELRHDRASNTWSAIRTSDGTSLGDNFPSRETARDALLRHGSLA